MFKKILATGILLSLICSPVISYAKPTKAELATAQQAYQSGFNAYKENNYKEAASRFMQASKLDPDNPIYALFSADMLRILKQDNASLRYYNQALDKIGKAKKDDKKKIELKTYLGLGELYANKDQAKAVSYVKTAIDKFPNDFKSYYTLGKIYSTSKETYPQAIEQYKKAIEQDKEQLLPYLALASVYNKQGNIEGVISTYKQACDYRPVDEALKMSLAQVYLADKDSNGKGRYNEAIEVLNSIIAVNNKNAFAHYYLALSYVLTDKTNEAEEQLGIVNNLNANLGTRLHDEMKLYYKKQMKENQSTEPKITIGQEDNVIEEITLDDNTSNNSSNKENPVIAKQLEKLMQNTKQF